MIFKADFSFFKVIPNFDVLIISDTLDLPRKMSLTKSRIFYPGKQDFIAATYRVYFKITLLGFLLNNRARHNNGM